MGNRYIRRLTLLAGGVGGLGGLLPDIDHFLSLLTDGKIPWAFLHQSISVSFLIGGIVASAIGLVATVVLGRSKL